MNFTNQSTTLLQNLAEALDEGDVVKFTDAVQEYDSMTRLVCVFY